MKNVFLFLTLCAVASCSVNKQNATAEAMKIQQPDWKQAKFIKPKAKHSDANTAAALTEMRLYDVTSAQDAAKMMYQNYGEWNERQTGQHQESVAQLRWNDVALFDDGNSYQVIVDGTETAKDYFTSIRVRDAQGEDCLAEDHLDRQRVVRMVISNMSSLTADDTIYDLLD